jgi:hypothetical protein
MSVERLYVLQIFTAHKHVNSANSVNSVKKILNFLKRENFFRFILKICITFAPTFEKYSV